MKKSIFIFCNLFSAIYFPIYHEVHNDGFDYDGFDFSINSKLNEGNFIEVLFHSNSYNIKGQADKFNLVQVTEETLIKELPKVISIKDNLKKKIGKSNKKRVTKNKLRQMHRNRSSISF